MNYRVHVVMVDTAPTSFQAGSVRRLGSSGPTASDPWVEQIAKIIASQGRLPRHAQASYSRMRSAGAWELTVPDHSIEPRRSLRIEAPPPLGHGLPEQPAPPVARPHRHDDTTPRG